MEELKFKGSPGPWKVFARGTLRDVVNDANGVWAALAHAQTHEEAEENARLIAAAPEMLEALLLFVEIDGKDYEMNEGMEMVRDWERLKDRVDKAIKKALEE